MNKKEIHKEWKKISDELYSDGDYHPYGWDWPTLRIVKPEIYSRFLALKKKAIDVNGGKPVSKVYFPA